ncbi:hypothetical protein ABBQ32_013804 [Trebouxia sp. C0010 RCD-2024]
MASSHVLLLCGKVSLVFLGPVAFVLVALFLILTYFAAVLLTVLYVPRAVLVNNLHWCCPFIPHIWRAQPWLKGQCMRLGFETTYTINVLRRLLTLPVRPHLPAFYIVGFPWMCFDACPVTACLPYTAKRIRALTPDAKLIFMLRDPVHCIFSAELMISNMGMPLAWSLSDPATQIQAHIKEQEDDAQLWKDLKDLQPGQSLPANMPELFYTRLNSLLMCGRYADRLQPFLHEFPRSRENNHEAAKHIGGHTASAIVSHEHDVH